MSIVVRRVEDVRLRYRWRKTSKSVAAALGVVLVGRVWFEGIQSLATFLGLVAAGLTIVLKDCSDSYCRLVLYHLAPTV